MGTFLKIFPVLVFILSAVLSFPTLLSAQTSDPRTLADFTAEKGWDCDSTVTFISTLGTGDSASCTATTKDQSSKYFGAKVACTGSTFETGNRGTCIVTLRDGTTIDVSTNNSLGAGDSSSVTRDRDGTPLSSTYNASPTFEGGTRCSASPMTWGYCALDAMGSAILGISTLLLGMAGVLLNLVIVKTVFQFSTLIGNQPGLLLAWGILRDLGNMLLLFGFIFIGIATILDLQTYSAKKALPRLLIFAILMNFSLFVAEAVIDVSNIMSAALYAQANSNPCLGYTDTSTIQVTKDSESVTSEQNCLLNYGLAGAAMQATGLSTMFQLGNDYRAPTTAVFLGLSLFAVIGAVVFFGAAIMLVSRAIILTLLMITAPIGFAAMALPPLQKVGEEWWNRLIHQAFFAPILILLILVSLKVSEGLSGGNENGLASALTQPNSSTMGVILVFALVIGLLVSSLIAAKKFGGMGADFAIGWSKKIALSPVTGGLAAGKWAGRQTAGVVGRNTVGKAGASVQRRYESWVGKEGAGGIGRWAAKNNFLGIDDAISGGAKKAQNTKFGGTRSYKESKDNKEARAKTFETEGRKAKNNEDLNAALAMQAGQLQDDRVAEILERMSTKEVEELDEMKKSGEKLDILAKNLSPEKFAAIIKDGGSLSESEKKQARDARFKTLAQEVTSYKNLMADPAATGPARDAAKNAIKARLKSYSSKDIENMSPDLLSEESVLDGLTGGQKEDLLKGNKVSPTISRELKRRDPVEQIKTDFASTADNDQAQRAVAIRVAGLKPKQVAKLSDEILANAHVMAILTPAMLNAINDAGDISPAARDAIRQGLSVRRAVDVAIRNYLDNTPGGALWV